MSLHGHASSVRVIPRSAVNRQYSSVYQSVNIIVGPTLHLDIIWASVNFCEVVLFVP